VIDTRYGKMKVYDPHFGMDALLVFPITLAAADERVGRVGRGGSGVCYSLIGFTQRVHSEMKCSPIQCPISRGPTLQCDFAA